MLNFSNRSFCILKGVKGVCVIGFAEEERLTFNAFVIHGVIIRTCRVVVEL